VLRPFGSVVREAGSPGRDAVRYAKLSSCGTGASIPGCSRAAGARYDPLGILEDGQRTLSFSEALMHATILVGPSHPSETRNTGIL
jgi:hypothetical protein